MKFVIIVEDRVWEGGASHRVASMGNSPTISHAC